ncbi:MAG: hypothetical protein HYS17_03145 [Micavibrio aeruginosavorus]|uniref:O-antigen ligase domain-containing protein n=1 Tax=Micavibrio aeruginosavorus TaxID=349221 RepID=A0A7T5R3B7_9BACT|nr:MAG: hypothetical protein HYS17_03145 [Micavibrio aeruginosavorus]
MARSLALLMALALYALLATPTPDNLGVIGFSIGLGLLFAAGVPGLIQVARPAQGPAGMPLFIPAARLLLMWGLCVPLLAGLMTGREATFILRDLVAFICLLLPLFLWPCLKNWPQADRLFPAMLCMVGIIFAVRVLWGAISEQGGAIRLYGFISDPDNLLNAPTALFALLYLTGTGGRLLGRASNSRSLLLAFLCFIPVLILLAAMLGVGQRAHIGAWGLALILWAGALIWRCPRALGRILLLTCPLIVLLALLPVAGLQGLLMGLLEKNTLVGFNNRLEEARVVFESFSGQPFWAVLFGQGWGAGITSPAAGPYPVNYTHSLLTTYLLKTGLCGFMLVLAYLAVLAAGIWRVLWVFPVGGVALAAPFLIDITLYASFKTLDFGLLLSLIVLWTNWVGSARQSCQNGPGWCMQEEYPE